MTDITNRDIEETKASADNISTLTVLQRAIIMNLSAERPVMPVKVGISTSGPT